MTKAKNRKPDEHAFRQRAEEQLAAREPIIDPAFPAVDIARPLHELMVHQIELEMQNEQLLRLDEESEASLEKYIDLYDFGGCPAHC